jgi:hypothetical protein
LVFSSNNKATCSGGGRLTRHSHYVRVRLGGITIWRLQCTTCRAVFTILPHFVVRYRQMHPTAIASPVRKVWRSQFHTLLYRARQRKGLRVFALGQRWRRFADHVATTAGAANGQRVRHWFQDKQAGWYMMLADPRMPVTSTWLDQAHNAIDRKLFMMKGFHHPKGSQQAFLRGLAHLYNLVPYQRRAQHAGQCGVEVEGGTVPTRDWCLNLQILTSGGFL